MFKKEIITKLALLVAYLLFSAFSAYFTASSLSLNLLNGTSLWLVFILVMVVAALAGYCLSEAINEGQKRYGVSRLKFALNVIGFLIFWAFSFTTNVHYFFVQKHGFSILSKELASAKTYVVDNTTNSDRAIEDEKNNAMRKVEAEIGAMQRNFVYELNNTRENHLGFGDACIGILQETEQILKSDTARWGDSRNDYRIFIENTDAGDRGITERNRFPYLQSKYQNRIQEAQSRKMEAIKRFYNRKKNQKSELQELLSVIIDLEENNLREIEKNKDIDEYYKYNTLQDARVMTKMPKDFEEENVVKKEGRIDSYKVYPSKRMFDTMSVWGDLTHGRLPDMPMIQWIIIALIFDLVSFILFCLFRKQ